MTFLTAAFSLQAVGATAVPLNFPESFGSKSTLTMVQAPRTWSVDTMYEHVNGEAELLKRYGAVSLTYVFYEAEGGAYLSADVLDMGLPLNAFGLYRLYAGCDGEERKVGSVRVLSGDFTSYAYLGPYFMRIDFEAGESGVDGQTLSDSFISALARGLSTPEALPPVIGQLNNLSRNPCEVSYHPEHINYDLESGPGFSWIGKDGNQYYVCFLTSTKSAREKAAGLISRGVPRVVVLDKTIAWPKGDAPGAAAYLENALKKLVE